MSAAKRRIKRKIKMLVRMLSTLAEMPWNRRYRNDEAFPLAQRQEQLFANCTALGRALSCKGHESKAMAAIDAAIGLDSLWSES